MTTTLSGPAGEARLVPLERFSAVDDHGASKATLAYWWLRLAEPYLMVVDVPAGSDPSHAAADNISLRPLGPGPDRMDTFAVVLITLADIDGVAPATKRFPWCTHELMVATLNPAEPHEFDSPVPWGILQPVNLAIQFEVADDTQALEVATAACRGIVAGVLPPEVQAYVPQLEKMMTIAALHHVWQDAVDRTAEHARTGGSHDEPHPRSGR